MTELKTEVTSLIRKAEMAEKSEDALRFSQAALNAANAIIGLSNQTNKT